MMVLWNGILFGLLLTIFIGPVFFALIQTSIEKGFYSGVFMALGIALSDAFYVSISYFGISQLFNADSINFWLGMAGGFIMLGFGAVSLLKPVNAPKTQEIHIGGKIGMFRQTVKGFLLNGINPSVFLFWIGIATMATVNLNYSGSYAIGFFATIISTVFLTDVLKSFLAHKLKRMLTLKFMRWMNIVVGCGLMIFGLRLLYFAIESW